MKTRILTILVLILILSSCRAIRVSDLQPEPLDAPLLPKMEPLVNVYSIRNAYQPGSSTVWIYNLGFRRLPDDGIVPLNSIAEKTGWSSDPRMNDLLTLYGREVEQNICEAGGDLRGSMVIETPVVLHQNKGTFLIIFPTSLSLGVSALLGIPSYFFQTEMEIEITIRNLDEEAIATYTGYGKGRVPVALYYGYHVPLLIRQGTEPGLRKANADAFKMAMRDIRHQIQNDREMLTGKLNAAED